MSGENQPTLWTYLAAAIAVVSSIALLGLWFSTKDSISALNGEIVTLRENVKNLEAKLSIEEVAVERAIGRERGARSFAGESVLL